MGLSFTFAVCLFGKRRTYLEVKAFERNILAFNFPRKNKLSFDADLPRLADRFIWFFYDLDFNIITLELYWNLWNDIIVFDLILCFLVVVFRQNLAIILQKKLFHKKSFFAEKNFKIINNHKYQRQKKRAMRKW